MPTIRELMAMSPFIETCLLVEVESGSMSDLPCASTENRVSFLVTRKTVLWANGAAWLLNRCAMDLFPAWAILPPSNARANELASTYALLVFRPAYCGARFL